MQSCSKAILLASIKLYCLSLPLIISHVIASGEEKEFCLMIQQFLKPLDVFFRARQDEIRRKPFNHSQPRSNTYHFVVVNIQRVEHKQLKNFHTRTFIMLLLGQSSARTKEAKGLIDKKFLTLIQFLKKQYRQTMGRIEHFQSFKQC